MVAVVSGDRTKRREIAQRYKLTHTFTYEEYEQCLSLVDAVYIALPTPCMRSTRFVRPELASTCSARSRWP